MGAQLGATVPRNFPAGIEGHAIGFTRKNENGGLREFGAEAQGRFQCEEASYQHTLRGTRQRMIPKHMNYHSTSV